MIQQMIRQGGKDYKKEMDLPETFNLLLASNDLPDIIDAFTNFYSLGMDYAVQEELESMGIQDLIDAYQAAYPWAFRPSRVRSGPAMPHLTSLCNRVTI